MTQISISNIVLILAIVAYVLVEVLKIKSKQKAFTHSMAAMQNLITEGLYILTNPPAPAEQPIAPGNFNNCENKAEAEKKETPPAADHVMD